MNKGKEFKRSRRGPNEGGVFSKRFASERFGIGAAGRVFDHGNKE